MSSSWSKFKLWTRLVIFGAAAIYVLVFIILNRTHYVHLHFVFKDFPEVSVLIVLLVTGVSSIIGWWLFKTIFLTMRQMREVNRRGALEKAEKEHVDRLEKAAKLQTKPETAAKAE
jgi:hypothetical protein